MGKDWKDIMSKSDSKAQQIKVSGRIKETAQETEMMVVQFSLGELLQLAKERGLSEGEDGTVLVLANIPEDGKNRAPSYVKVLTPDEMGQQNAA